LLAKDVGTFHAAQLAAFINGVAGEIAFQEMSYGLLATDVAGKIPYVLRRYV
jgi:NAD(P)H-hydrate epimerase